MWGVDVFALEKRDKYKRSQGWCGIYEIKSKRSEHLKQTARSSVGLMPFVGDKVLLCCVPTAAEWSNRPHKPLNWKNR